MKNNDQAVPGSAVRNKEWSDVLDAAYLSGADPSEAQAMLDAVKLLDMPPENVRCRVKLLWTVDGTAAPRVVLL